MPQWDVVIEGDNVTQFYDTLTDTERAALLTYNNCSSATWRVRCGEETYKTFCFFPSWKSNSLKPTLRTPDGPLSPYVISNINSLRKGVNPTYPLLQSIEADLCSFDLSSELERISALPPHTVRLRNMWCQGVCCPGNLIMIDAHLFDNEFNDHHPLEGRLLQQQVTLVHELRHSAETDRSPNQYYAHSRLPGVHKADIVAVRALDEAPNFSAKFASALRYIDSTVGHIPRRYENMSLNKGKPFILDPKSGNIEVAKQNPFTGQLYLF